MQAPQFMHSPTFSLLSSFLFLSRYAFSSLSGISSIAQALTHLPQRMQEVAAGSVYSLSARKELLVLTTGVSALIYVSSGEFQKFAYHCSDRREYVHRLLHCRSFHSDPAAYERYSALCVSVDESHS